MRNFEEAGVGRNRQIFIELSRTPLSSVATLQVTMEGFLDRLQGIRGVVNSEDTARGMAEEIFETLAAQNSAKGPLSEGLASRLKFAGSWDASGFITDKLVQLGRFSEAATATIRLAIAANDQIGVNEELLALLGDEAQ